MTGQPFGLTLFYQNIGKEPARNLAYYQGARLEPVMKENGIVTGFQLPTDNICEKAYSKLSKLAKQPAA